MVSRVVIRGRYGQKHGMISLFRVPHWLTALCSAGLAAVPSARAASVCLVPAGDHDGRPLWAFETGVSFLTENTIDELLLGDASLANGRAGGEVYAFTLSRRLGRFRLGIGTSEFHPEFELPLTLEVVDENGRDPFLDFNAALLVRWTEFPWNERLRTTFATGVGLSYSEHVYQVDIDRHPGEDRSHLKFHWPIQLTFAHPEHPRHQLMLYLTHQSGGHIFDEGGVNSVGFGYRFGF